MPMETTELVDLQELLSPLTDSNRRPPLYEGGLAVKGAWCIGESGRAGELGLLSGALLSMASWWEDQVGWEVRSGGASP